MLKEGLLTSVKFCAADTYIFLSCFGDLLGVHTAETACCVFHFVFTRLEAVSTVYAHHFGILSRVACPLDGIKELPLTREDLPPGDLVHPIVWALLVHYATPDHVYLSVHTE